MLEDLTTDGLLSAGRYAEAVVASRSARGQGPLRIRSELEQMQIDAALVEGALQDCGVDWFASAVAVCRKRFGNEPPVDYKDRARRMRFLQQRGFDFDCIRVAVDGD